MDDLEDFFSTPRARDDNTLSTEGIEELFDLPRPKALEVDEADAILAAPAPHFSDDPALALSDIDVDQPANAMSWPAVDDVPAIVPAAPADAAPDPPALPPEPVLEVYPIGPTAPEEASAPAAEAATVSVDLPPAVNLSAQSMNELLEMLALDLRELAEKIGKLATVAE